MREWLHLVGHLPRNWSGPKWFETDEGDARLIEDRRLLSDKYPDLSFALNFRLQKAVLRGTITLKEENTRIPTTIRTKIILPDGYPEYEPFAFDDDDQFPHIADRHFYKNGLCCLWLPLESQWDPKDKVTFLNFVDQVALFFERQLMFDASGSWAWGQRGHGVDGYIEFLEEQLGGQQVIEAFSPLLFGKTTVSNNSKCPCGNGRNYKSCHKQNVDSIIKSVGKFRS
jgi:hypothetical protein